MVRLRRAALYGLILSLGVVAQPPPRQWAGAAEYDLARAVSQQRDPNRQLALLQEWEARYPGTDFEGLRVLSFARALARLNRFDEAFARATQLLHLNGSDPEALWLVAALGPKLVSPSPSQVSVVTEAASKLRMLKVGRSQASATDQPAMTSRELADPETQEVFNFIRELRAEHAARHPDPEVLKNEVIESAMTWAKRQKL